MSTSPNPLDPKQIPLAPKMTPQPNAASMSSGGNLITDAGGPSMTPAPAAPTQPDPSQSSSIPSSGHGIFGKIGAALKAAAPYLPSIANHVAAAAGNYAPLEAQHQEAELTLKQQNADLQRQLGESTLKTQGLGQQKSQLDLNNYRTPAQTQQDAAALADTEHRNSLKADTELGPGTPVSGAVAGGNQIGQYVRHGTTASPVTVASQDPNSPPQQLMALPKGMTKGAPIAQPGGGFAVPVYNAMQKIDHYETLDGTPIAALPTMTTGTTTAIHDTPQGPVPVSVPTNSTKSRVLPGPPTRPQIPLASGVPGQAPAASPNPMPSTAPKPNLGVKVGAPIIDPKAPPAVIDAFKTYSGSQERLAVMQDALPKGMAGDQQAQLNLLANHLGMTMGLQKGARMNQAMIDEAMKSAPWLQGMQARFGPDGYMVGVTLTPQQMTSMVDLAKVRTGEDAKAYSRIQQEAKGNFGMNRTGNEPPTLPSTAAAPSGFAAWKASQQPH